jgi:hypothetical protein
MEKRPFRILVGSGNQALATAGTSLYNTTTGAINLANGQLGIYNYKTKLAVNPASLAGVESIFLAQGIGSDSFVSSLRMDLRDVKYVTKQCYVSPLPQILELSWDKTKCETEYCIKVQLDSIDIQESLGYNFLDKTFFFTTGCCEDCSDCGGGNCVALADGLVSNINADPDGLFTAATVLTNDFSLTYDFSTPVTDPDLEVTIAGTTTTYPILGTWDTTNTVELQSAIQTIFDENGIFGTVSVTADSITVLNTQASALTFDTEDFTQTSIDSCPKITLTVNFPALATYCNLNPLYTFPRGVHMTAYPMCGFECNSSVIETQALRYEQGAGYDMADLAEEASGWYQNEVYRFTPSIRPDDLRVSYVNTAINYVQYNIYFHDRHEGAPSGHWFDSELFTKILVPTTGTTTITALDSAFNTMFSAGLASC